MGEDFQQKTSAFDEHKIQATVTGSSLVAWQVLTSKIERPDHLEDYLITFQETDSEVRIFFKKPVKNRILGGGGGMYVVKKATNEVIGEGLAK